MNVFFPKYFNLIHPLFEIYCDTFFLFIYIIQGIILKIFSNKNILYSAHILLNLNKKYKLLIL